MRIRHALDAYLRKAHPLLASRLADQDSVQMLQRSSQVGEFYRMAPPAVYNSKKRLPATYMGTRAIAHASTDTLHPSAILVIERLLCMCVCCVLADIMI